MLFEALTQPQRDAARPWLFLLDDEAPPMVVEAAPPHFLVWSSLWPRRSDVRIRFELPADRSRQGTDLVWTLLADEPSPDESLVGHMRKRVNQLINRDLRLSLGQ